ncbi:hypothetical protein IC762_28095 [Bradyrhizobium genosp. L]|uniref:hypothetical protein n=1 Tax=Bradyrhizobium genosp. L TaxID=83637 RepID=UPI0018A2F0EB|nr:hypothetical protein [Bradyrhizobium genosp. L]QPF83535.1 hypothetical protein IC762_28095 [Bradyrhizobium genosp. L]
MSANAGGTTTSTFQTMIGSTRVPPSSTETTHPSAPGLPLTLSVTMEGDDPNITVQLGDTDVLGGDDDASYADLVAGAGDTLVIKIDLSAIASLACNGSPDFYLICSATIDAAGAAFQGSVQSICRDRKGVGDFKWTGHVPPGVAAETRRVCRRIVDELKRREIKA